MEDETTDGEEAGEEPAEGVEEPDAVVDHPARAEAEERGGDGRAAEDVREEEREGREPVARALAVGARVDARAAQAAEQHAVQHDKERGAAHRADVAPRRQRRKEVCDLRHQWDSH